MKSVFVVERGRYSDYHVVGVYSSRKNAKQIADALNAGDTYGDAATVAEWPIDPAVAELNQGMKQHTIVMLADGTVERCDAREFSAYEIGGSVEIWRRTQAPAYKGKAIPDALMATIWAKDATHAIKIANEKRAEMIADGRWKP
jgi:hypothetical protein